MQKNTISACILSAAVVGGLVYFLKPSQIDTSVSKEPNTSEASATAAQTTGGEDSVSTANVASVDVVAERLRKRLEKQPDDQEGWVLLGRSYLYLQNENKAREAFAKAVDLGYSGPLPDFTSAQARQSADSQPISNPHEPMNRLANSIETATQKPAAAPNENSPKPFANGIPVKVSLAASIADKVSPDDIVFIFARAPNGPKMPLSVVKKQVKDLPLTLNLTDATSMMPTFSLSSARAVIVGARISKSGGVVKRSGDFEVLSSAIDKKPERPIELLIENEF